MLKSLSTLILLLALLVSGCTIEKRLYRKGWYISSRKEWRSDGAKELTNYKSEQSKIVRQEAANRFTIDTSDLKWVSVTDSINEQQPESQYECLLKDCKEVVRKASKNENRAASLSVEKAPEPGYERTKESRKARAMAVILIGFSYLMLTILLATNPVSLTLLSLWWFAGIILILFFGFISIDLSARLKFKLKWVEISGDSLAAYKSVLRSKAFKLSLFTVVVGTFILILTFSAPETLLLFSSIIVVLLLLSLGAWNDYRKIKKANIFFVSSDTATDKEIGEEPFFRQLTPEELSLRKRMRLRKAIFFQVFLVISLVILLLLFVATSTLSYTVISVLVLFFCLFTFLIWFELISKSKHPERERIRVEETLYRELTPDELAARRKKRLVKSIFLQVFFSVFFGLILLPFTGVGSIPLTMLLIITLLFTFFTFVIWFDFIQKNNHPEREKMKIEEPASETSQTVDEKEDELPESISPEEKMKQLKHTLSFLIFAAIAFLIVTLLIPSEFLWVLTGAFALGAILTFFQILHFKRSLSTHKS